MFTNRESVVCRTPSSPQVTPEALYFGRLQENKKFLVSTLCLTFEVFPRGMP